MVCPNGYGARLTGPALVRVRISQLQFALFFEVSYGHCLFDEFALHSLYRGRFTSPPINAVIIQVVTAQRGALSTLLMGFRACMSS